MIKNVAKSNYTSTSATYKCQPASREQAETALKPPRAGAWILRKTVEEGTILSVKLSEDYIEHYPVKNEGDLWYQMDPETDSKISDGFTFEKLLKECEGNPGLHQTGQSSTVDFSTSPHFHSFTKNQAAESLQGRPPGTFLFYPSQEKQNICLASVDEKGVVQHQKLIDQFGVNGYNSLEHYVQTHKALTIPYKPVPQPVQAPSFRIALPDKTDATLHTEYHQLPNNINDLHKCTYALSAENTSKNRFINIMPFDDNAFRGNDFYYNASVLFEGKALAAQGPESRHCDDFWKMIWQSDSRTIAMLTKTAECCQYWPEGEESVTYGSITIQPISRTAQNNLITRKLTIQSGSEKRTVTHHQFTGWPDHSTASLEEMAALVEKLACSFSRENPLTVHCRAGIGRTGTLLTALMTYQKIREDSSKGLDSDLYHKTARAMREGRMAAIQTPEQYLCGYRTLEELLKNV